MIVRALDADHDWTFGKGRNNYLRNVDAIQQTIETRLLSFLGDCFFDVTAGIDWFGLLGGKNRQALELAIAAVILNTEGVTALVTLDTDLDPITRLFTATYVVNTTFSGIASLGSELAASTNFILTQDGIILTTQDGNPITTQGGA